MRTLRILVLEDEQRAGEKLIDYINMVAKNVKIKWIRSISETMQFLSNEPELDLIFSDIELIDGNVFKVYENIQPKSPIIFCTAYNSFYEDAFKTNGIAYLLKPYEKQAFQSTWDKFQLLFNDKKEHLSSTLLFTLKRLIESEQGKYKTTFPVKKRDGVFLLKIDTVIYFQAHGDFVLGIDRHDKKHILNDSLTNIAKQLNKDVFFRINRSEIVNRNYVVKYKQYIKNRLAISFSNLEITLFTSNSRTPEFRNWIDR